MRVGHSSGTDQGESCGLTTAGQAYCFSATSSTPLAGSFTFDAFDRGSEHSCGLSNGDVYCWGGNRHANLGLGSADSLAHPDPVKVPSSARFTAIGVGEASTCALDTTGVVQCWGYNDQAYKVALCDATIVDCVMTPTPVSGGRTYTALAQSDGGAGLCALTPDGLVDCWSSATKPPQSPVFPEPVRAISMAGSTYISNSGCALSATNVLYCWDPAFTVKKFP